MSAAAALPRWVPPWFVVVLALPFHPHWLDFEQVRRGLLLMLVGGLLLLRPPVLRRAGPGSWAFLLLLGWMVASAVVQGPALQSWAALERLLHLGALGIVMVFGTATATLVDWGRAAAPALALWSAYGLAQALGHDPIGHYGGPGAAVSTFGNLNVASECTAVAAAATAASWIRAPRSFLLGSVALVLAGAYLWVNGSRSGLIALPIALLVLLAAGRTRPRRRAVPLWLAAGGAALALGLTLALGPAKPAVPDSPSAPSTLAVRVEIAKAGVEMARERPEFGHGPGQFRIAYPRYRRAEEIELSSHGRQFATEVRTAHDDYLEVLVEGGAPALGFLLLFLLLRALGLRRHSPEGLAPLVAFAALMLARSPLGNAPAAALALLTATVPPPGVARPGTRPRWMVRALRLCGALLIAAGLSPVLGNTLFAPYLSARTASGHADPAPIRRALVVQPQEPRYHNLLATEVGRDALQPDLVAYDPARTGAAALAALPHAEAALALSPDEPSLHLLAGELLQGAGRLPEARVAVQRARALDPGSPEARVLLSAIAFHQGNHTAAIAAVWDQPHPTLRARLPAHFATLGETVARQGFAVTAERYAAEGAFAAQLLARDDQSEEGLRRASTRVPAMLEAFRRAALLQRDARPWWLAALHALDIGDQESARSAAREVAGNGLQIPRWHRDLVPEEDWRRLAAVEGWARVLQ